jgi:hypothetical protein
MPVELATKEHMERKRGEEARLSGLLRSLRSLAALVFPFARTGVQPTCRLN